MSATAAISIRSTVNGLPEGGVDSISIALTNTSAVGSLIHTTASTAISAASTFTVPSSAKYLIVSPPTTNNLPIRIGDSTASSQGGIPLSSNEPSLISIGGATTFYCWTTGSTAVTPVRVQIL